MLSRRPRSWAIPGRGIWAGLALTPVLIALAALVASAFVGGAATAGPAADASAVSPAAAKARVRPTMTRTEAASAVRDYWTPARVARATDVTSGARVNSRDVPEVLGLPHTSFNWYPGFPRRPQYRSVLIYYTQGGTEHVCSGGVVGWDDVNTSPTAIEGPTNIVWTAGRCVHRGDGLESGWSDNLLACPIHVDSGPFISGGGGGTANTNEGCWVWLAEATTPEWYGDNWESRDYGVIFLSNQRVAGPGTSCSPSCPIISGQDIANYPTTPTNNAKGTLALCDESTYGGHVPGRSGGGPCAYNLARSQHWWAVGYHHVDRLLDHNGLPATQGAVPASARCSTTAPAPVITHQCLRQTLRVTQTQFAATHANLTTSVPALCGPSSIACAADTGPLVNTVGAYEQAGVDSLRLTAGSCPAIGNTGQTGVDPQGVPCTGSFTGAPWVLNWSGTEGGANANRGRFGNAMLNSNTSYADSGEDDRPDGAMQGVYFDTVTCFDYQAWTTWPGTCS